MFRRIVFLSLLMGSNSAIWAQAAHTQTAREALIEMLSGTTQQSFERHLLKETALRIHQLTAEQQQQFQMSRAMVKSGGGQNDVTWFGDGPVLVSYTDLKTSTKFDIVVEKDELAEAAGTEEMELSFRSSGPVQKGISSLVPRLLISMKLEDDTWKLAEIGFSMKVKLDAALLDNFTERLARPKPAASAAPIVTPNPPTNEQPKAIAARSLSKEEQSAAEAVRSLVAAEKAYKHDNPQAGYTCSLADLGQQAANIDGYRISLLGCRGVPGSSYKVMAVPEGADRYGRRAFCADESGVVKFSDDGRGLTCLTENNLLK